MWYPGESLAAEDSNEPATGITNRKHKRRKASIIERRKEATVDVRGVTTIAVSPAESCVLPGYSTVESNSINGLEKFENWKDDEDMQASCVSGWKGDENVARMVLHKPYSDSTVINDSIRNIQSREACNRLYSSRLNTQMSKKREKYKFTHAKSPEEHMRTYNESCSYSLLVCTTNKGKSKPSAKEEVMEEEGGVVEKEENDEERKQLLPKPHIVSTKTSTRTAKLQKDRSHRPESRIPMIPMVTCTGASTADRILHTLANRLGVKESIDEPKLLCSPTVRSTAPSITRKKNESRDDLVLCPESRSGVNKKQSDDSNSSQSRPATKQSKERRTPHQLPKIHRNQKSTSSISLSKYFHVNTKNDKHKTEMIEAEEGEDTIPLSSSVHSLISNQSCEGEEECRPYQLQDDCPDDWPHFTPVDPLGNILQKEVAIRRKADSLGLLSHKWAKNFIERGFMNGSLPRKVFYDYSRQPSREAAAARNNNGQKLSAKQKEKMQELRGVYTNKGNKNSLKNSANKQKRNRDVFTATNGANRNSSNKAQKSLTRPPTRVASVTVEDRSKLSHNKIAVHHRPHKSDTLNRQRQHLAVFLPTGSAASKFQLQGLIQKMPVRLS